MIAVPDVNVLLYSVDSKSPSHQPCVDWLNGALNGNEPLGFTWQSIAGFVRIGMNPRVLNRPMTLAEAFGNLEAWLACRASRILHPGTNHLSLLKRFLDAVGGGGNFASDAHLAAIGLKHDGEVVSCDSDFERFQGLKSFDPVTGLRTR
jgi:uncharacterized protein